MNITILDDYQDTIRTLACFGKTAGHHVTIWNDHTKDVTMLAARLKDTEALAVIRERTPIRAPLLERLDKLRLISQTGVYPHLDVEACTRRGVIVSSYMAPGRPSYATADLGAHHRRAPPHPSGDCGAPCWEVAGVPHRDGPAREGAWHLWLRTGRCRRCRLRQGLRHEGAGLGARGVAHQGARGRPCRRGEQGGAVRRVGRAVAAPAADRRDSRHRRSGRPRPDEADRAPRQHQPGRADRAGGPGGRATRGAAGYGGSRRLRGRAGPRSAASPAHDRQRDLHPAPRLRGARRAGDHVQHDLRPDPRLRERQADQRREPRGAALGSPVERYSINLDTKYAPLELVDARRCVHGSLV